MYRSNNQSDIGAMDTDDLARIDVDLDKLRGNEEQVKHTIERQTEVVNTIYNFVNDSMIQIDSKMRSLYEKLQLLFPKQCSRNIIIGE